MGQSGSGLGAVCDRSESGLEDGSGLGSGEALGAIWERSRSGLGPVWARSGSGLEDGSGLGSERSGIRSWSRKSAKNERVKCDVKEYLCPIMS